MKIAIIANGTLKDIPFHRNILQNVDKIIAADGGLNNCHSLGIVPDHVIGDMDSVDHKILDKATTDIIVDPDQGKTDTQLAITLAESFSPDEIILLCAIGSRLDHTLANIQVLTPKIRMVDPNNDIRVVTDSLDLEGNEGDVVSVIALTDIEGLSYDGLKWEMKNENVKNGWIGVCNKILHANARISLRQGKVLVIRAKD